MEKNKVTVDIQLIFFSNMRPDDYGSRVASYKTNELFVTMKQHDKYE